MNIFRPFLRILLFAVLTGPAVETGFSKEAPPQAEVADTPQQLNRTIDEVITRPEFSWRLPREAVEASEEGGLLVDFLDEIRNLIKETAKRSEKYLKRFAEWMEDIFGHRKRRPEKEKSCGFDWQLVPRALLIVLLTAAACTAGIVIVRLIRKRKKLKKEAAPSVRFAAPDLQQEDVTADQLETTAWLELADEMRGKGEYRLAARALFLAGLAHMAEQHYISIARFKSNREYSRELIRRARDRQPLVDTFSQCIFYFESAWYGRHPVTPENMTGYTADIHRIIHEF